MGLFGDSPADIANQYLDQIPPELQKYYDPYINRGQKAGGILDDLYGAMAKDPNAFFNQLISGYKQSPGFKAGLDSALNASANAAAAGGVRGSDNDRINSGLLADRLQQQDMQQYFNNILGISDRGRQGEQSLYNTGFDASKGLSGDLANIFGQKAQLGYKDKVGQLQDIQSILKTLGQIPGLLAMFA